MKEFGVVYTHCVGFIVMVPTKTLRLGARESSLNKPGVFHTFMLSSMFWRGCGVRYCRKSSVSYVICSLFSCWASC